MKYAKFIAKGIFVKFEPFEGAKQLVETEPEFMYGYRPVRSFVESEDKIEAVWDYIKLTEEEMREIEEEQRNSDMDEPVEVDKAEAYDIIIGGEINE